MNETKDLLTKLMQKCGLGEITSPVEPVSGGLMHRMYKVTTDTGSYAVKHLNAEIMKRPDVFDNYGRAEKIEAILEQNDIPMVPALMFGGKKMQCIEANYFYVFRWQNGSIADWNHISKEQCYMAGNILGKIHAIEPKNVEAEEPEVSRIDWQGYIRKAKAQNSAIAAFLEEKQELLVYAENELNKAKAALPAMRCISNEDMDPKNIMWENGLPWMIDLECLDYGNPMSHAVVLALQWAGTVTESLDIDKLVGFFEGYLKAYDNGFRGYHNLVGVAYNWVDWLEYNIQRALGNCVDGAERELGISEVRNTIRRIEYLREVEPQIKEALQAKVGETMVKLYSPKLEDLWFRQMFMADEETMSYNHQWGGTIPFPKGNWAAWYDFWVVNPEGKRFYRYLQEENSGEFVGEIAYHFDEEEKKYIADVIVYAKYRGKGFGKQGLLLLCEAAKANGIDILYDNIAIDNPAIKLFLKVGFYEEYRTDEIIMLKKEL